jgi:hypothetical protein
MLTIIAMEGQKSRPVEVASDIRRKPMIES